MESESLPIAPIPESAPVLETLPPPMVSGPKKRPVSPKVLWICAAVSFLMVSTAVLTSVVYLRPPTDSFVQKVVGVFPYPAAVVGSDMISMKSFLNERMALNKYFEANTSIDSPMPSEQEIAVNIIDTLVHKTAVEQLAEEVSVIVDETRVEEFYVDATGGGDPAAFALELDTMFGWTTDQFRERVIRPVVLTMQLSEYVSKDETRQAEPLAKANSAYDRLVAGEEFALVATDTSIDPSATSGGDIGFINLTDIPEEWQVAVSELEVGSYTEVLEGDLTYMIFLLTDRVVAGEDTQVKLSLIAVSKVTLEEIVQAYLESVRVWKFVGRT